MNLSTLVGDKFPLDSTDDELRKDLEKLAEKMRRASYNEISWLGAALQVGAAELQSRENIRSLSLSRKISYLSISIAGLAIIFSLLSIHSSNGWEGKQIKILQSLDTQGQVISAALGQIESAVTKIGDGTSIDVRVVSDEVAAVHRELVTLNKSTARLVQHSKVVVKQQKP